MARWIDGVLGSTFTRMRQIASPIACVVVLAVFLGSCTVREDIVLRADGSGEAVLDIDLHPILIEYLNDLASAMTGIEGEHPILDIVRVAEAVNERPEIELTHAEQRGRGGLRLAVSFTDIGAMFAREGAQNVLRLETRGGQRELTVRLSRDTVHRFLEYAPEESASLIELLLPAPDRRVSREAYRDELAWALEEYERRSVVERVLDEAAIEIRITPVGRIVEQRGGRVVGDAVVFTIPVLELLTLQEERVYSLVFAP